MANGLTISKPSTEFIWVIDNFSYWCSEVYGDHISSPKFSFSGSRNERFSLLLYPNGKFEGDVPFRVQLQPHSQFPGFTIDCVLSFLDKDGLIVVAIPAKDEVIIYTRALVLPPASDDAVLMIRKLSSHPADVLTLKLEILKKEEISAERYEYLANTRLEMRRTRYIWPKHYFSQFTFGQKATIPLSLNMFQQKLGCLKCELLVEGPPFQSSVVNLEVLGLDHKSTLLVILKISLVNEQQETVENHEDKYAFRKGNHVYKFQLPCFVTRRDLIETHHCEFSVSIFSSSGISEGIDAITKNSESLQFSSKDKSDVNPSRLPIRDT